MFYSYEDQEGATNGEALSGFFKDAQGFRQLDAGSRNIIRMNGKWLELSVSCILSR